MPTRAEIITLGVTTGALGVGAFTIGPALLSAGTEAPPKVMPTDPRLADSCTAIDELFTKALGIVRVWRDETGSPRDVLLWHRDIRDPDVINRNEIVLLTYSTALGALTAYTCVADDPPDLAGELGIEVDQPPERRPDPCAGPIRWSSINEQFPWAWKTSGMTERKLLATGLENMTFTPVREPNGATRWSVELTWGGGATDTDPQACALYVQSVR